ncbi:MAG: ABC transporter permease [Rhodobacteraceae bacterium]|jgi:simple sugar transport system permease protein|nr:ABC transporter permease [Paracoccaceae bacterium]
MDGRTLNLPRDTEARAALGLIAAGALLLPGLIAVAGENPLRVLGLMVAGAFLDLRGLADTVVRAIPLCLMGLGVAVAFRARVFNIGGDGQFLIGAALAVAASGWLVLLPAPLGVVALLAAGTLGGALWGGIAGVLRARFNANEIIATILLNYIALHVLSWLIRGPLQEAAGVFPRTDRLPPDLRLPMLVDAARISAGLAVALVAVGVLWLVMARSRFGFQVTALGENPEAARYGGVRPGLITAAVLALSGALAGLAGIVEVAGVHGRIQDGFGAGLGISGIAVALLARLNPLWVPASAFGFAGLHVGSATVARATAVPFPVVNVIEGAIILAYLAALALRGRQRAG